ncbi:hypothetical protein P7K49_019363 [Saguinus oedipus]|uniref:Uncharacterized protein n=1 Tax=Saguinus oedipus TaxID=9490 RepID=A0ABQ9UXF5_SAGOE|nr:hypothetical protein P7K49_019363 [Saguinus oedipus]
MLALHDCLHQDCWGFSCWSAMRASPALLIPDSCVFTSKGVNENKSEMSAWSYCPQGKEVDVSIVKSLKTPKDLQPRTAAAGSNEDMEENKFVEDTENGTHGRRAGPIQHMEGGKSASLTEVYDRK